MVERERDLRRPVEHLALGKVSPRLARAADVGEQVALLGVGGDDAQRLGLLLEEGLLVRDDVRVAQLREELRLPAPRRAAPSCAPGSSSPRTDGALAVHHEVARPVVTAPDHLAELVLLHRAGPRSLGKAPGRTNDREPARLCDSPRGRGCPMRCRLRTFPRRRGGVEGGSGSRVTAREDSPARLARSSAERREDGRVTPRVRCRARSGG